MDNIHTTYTPLVIHNKCLGAAAGSVGPFILAIDMQIQTIYRPHPSCLYHRFSDSRYAIYMRFRLCVNPAVSP